MMSQNMTKMMSEMKAADAKLDALVQAMNAAKGAEKTGCDRGGGDSPRRAAPFDARLDMK